MRPVRMVAVSATLTCAVVAGGVAASASPVGAGPAGAETAAVGAPAPLSSTRAINSADKAFVRMMVPHHWQAIVMTELAPSRSTDREVLAIADRINTEQGLEIQSMQGWQARNGLAVTDPQDSYQQLLQDPEMLEQMGMATPAELDRLESLQGNAFDVLFLQLMIPHHEGAIAMAEDVARDGSDLYVRQLAIDIISTQSRQVYDMQQVLDRKTG